MKNKAFLVATSLLSQMSGFHTISKNYKMSGLKTTRRNFIGAGSLVLAGASTSALTTVEDLQQVKNIEKYDNSVTLGLIQMRCDGNPAENLKKALRQIKEARSKGADIIVLPELFATKYFCQDDTKEGIAASKREYAIPLRSSTTEALATAAKENRIVLIGGSVFEKADDNYFNTSIVFGPDGNQLGHYRKTHIPHDPGFWEQHYFMRGNTGVRVFDTPFGKIAIQICYDQWFPELARLAALQGARILVYPTAIGDVDNGKDVGEGNWQQMWTAAQVGHAACNNIYVAAVNRVGLEGKLSFFGGSFVADPMGRVLHQAGTAEEVVIVKCDLTFAANTQKGWRFFEERRPDQYLSLGK